jgi:cystinosin
MALNGSDKARNEYRERWGSDPMIPIQDIFFAIHAFILTFIVFLQSVVYSRELKISRWVEAFCFLISFFCLVFLIGALDDFFSFLDWLYFLSGVKMFVTLTKYIPQVRRSGMTLLR